MSDEKGVTLKRKASLNVNNDLICICHYSHCTDKEVVCLSESQHQTLCHAVRVRQAQSSVGPRLDELCANLPTVFDIATHGCHRLCYKNFTNISRLRAAVCENSTTLDAWYCAVISCSLL